MSTKATTPTEPARITTTIREATPEAIDPARYQSLDAHEERYYLVAIVEQRDVVDESREYLGIFATADGTRVAAPRYTAGEPPHALAITIGAGPHYDSRLATPADVLAELVANAHPEVPAR